MWPKAERIYWEIQTGACSSASDKQIHFTNQTLTTHSKLQLMYIHNRQALWQTFLKRLRVKSLWMNH